jgi:branched-chain amino acid transport system substrate-binding protein
VGFDAMNSIAVAIAKAGSTDNEKLVEAMRGLKFTSAFGPVEYRAIDHNPPSALCRQDRVKNGRGTMVDWSYRDGAKYLPSDEVVRTLRPQG